MYKFSATGTLFVVISIHILFFLSLLRCLIGLDILGLFLSEDYSYNKLILMPIVSIFFVLFIRSFSGNKGEKIISKWPENYKLITAKNIFFLFVIIVIPATLMICFANYIQDHQPIYKIFG